MDQSNQENTTHIPESNDTDHHQPSVHHDDTENDKNRSTVIGAAAVGAIAGVTVLSMIGLVIPAAVVGLVGGAAAGVYAVTRNDEVGNQARRVGSTVGVVIDKATELSKEHKIPEKVGSVAETTYEKAKEIDKEYKVSDKVAMAAEAAAIATVTTAESISKFSQEHQIEEKLEHAAKGAYEAAVKLDDEYQIRNRATSAVNAIKEKISPNEQPSNSESQ